MTSADIVDSAPATAGCVRGKGSHEGTSCSGGGESCLMVRSSTLATAYVLGCRSDAARQANTAKARARRERVRSDRADAVTGEWWGDDIPEREPTGETCPECGLPMYWEPGRGAQTCERGHWELAPGTESRVKHAPEREPGPVKPSVMDNVRVDVERARIVNECVNALARLNTDQITELYVRNALAPSWNEAISQQYIAGFESLVKQAKSADESGLAEIDQAVRQLANAPEFSVLLQQIRTGARDLADTLTRRSQIARGEKRYRVIPNSNEIEEFSIESGQMLPGSGNRVIPGSVERRAIERGSGNPKDDTGDDGYDDDDYDDDDYDDDDYDDDETWDTRERVTGVFPYKGVLIIGGIILVIWLGYQAKLAWVRNGYIICQYQEHHGIRPQLARYLTEAPYAGFGVYTCAKKKCRTRAETESGEHVTLGYEIKVWGLADANGNQSDSPNFTGVRVP